MVLSGVVIDRASEALRCAVLCLTFVLASCHQPSPRTPTLSVVDTSGAHTTFPGDLARSRLTVLIFYAERCPCFRAHEERIRELSRAYAPRGVDFLLVDSEVDATMDRAVAAVQERKLPRMALDPGGRIASALGAEYATYSVVLDASGRVRYRGGIDSDKNRLTDRPREYLREALEDILAGREPRRSEAKSLGCALQTR
jgi:hypothetical protein